MRKDAEHAGSHAAKRDILKRLRAEAAALTLGQLLQEREDAALEIERLRRKIEADPANPKYVLTVWGTGYKFADD